MDNATLIAKYSTKASGSYRELIDATGSPLIESTTNIVVLIQSEQGPIMNPVYVEDQTMLHTIFGRRNIKLEQRGNFGILTAEHVLEQGPCWILNIKNINQYQEVLATVQLACNKEEVTLASEFPISEVFDTNKFWKPSKYFAIGEDFSAFTVSSVLNETISVIITKDKYDEQYDQTIGSVKALHPTFAGAGLNDDAYISDYMVTVHVFKSDLTQALLSNSGVVVAGKVQLDKLELLVADPRAKYFTSYEGTVGDVIDETGSNLNIATKINADTLNSGLFATINKDAILAKATDLMAFESIDIPASYDDAIRVLPTIPMNLLGYSDVAVGSKYIDGVLSKDLDVEQNQIYVRLQATPAADEITVEDIAIGTPILIDGETPIRIIDRQFISENLRIEDETIIGTIDAPVLEDKTPYPVNSQGVPVYPIGHVWAKQPVRFVEGEAYVVRTATLVDGSIVESTYDTEAYTYTQEEIDAIAKVYGLSYPIYQLTLQSPIHIPATENSTERATVNDETDEYNVFHGYAIQSWMDAITEAPIFAMHGIIDAAEHYVNGTSARQNLILAKLTESAFVNSFSDPTVFKCRYMVDSFKTYIEPNAKYQLGQLAGECKRFPVFIPSPFYGDLIKSKNPDFKDLLGKFQMSYVFRGSNPDKQSTNSFSFPQAIDSAPWLIPVMNASYFDGFSDHIVPATGAVAKAYYSKHTGTRKVYDIVGGADYPITAAGISGPEETFDSGDRGYLERTGINVLLKIDGVLQLRSSKTAYQAVRSALNSPETIEKFLFLSDSVEPIIGSKLFKYNDVNSRTAVKQKADTTCDIMKADGAIYDYENICDLSNNGVDVRKEGIIILDSILYNEFGIRIGVHRTTLKLPEA